MRRAAVAAVAFAFAPEARPQDSNPASPNEARAQPDAIAGAKKDFQSIKSVRDEALLPKSGLPRVSLPELPARSPSPGVVTNPTTPPREAKPGNWLVEAMEKPDTLRNPRGADARSRDRRGKSESAEGISDAEKGERRHFAGGRRVT